MLDSFGAGGKERRCLQLVQGLNEQGVKEVQLIIINNDISYPEIYATSARIIVIDRKNKGLSPLATYKMLKKHLNAFKPDIVQGWGFLSLFFLNLIKLTTKFIYIASHVADANPPHGINKLINTAAIHLSDAVVGNSRAGLVAYKIPDKKAYCFYNGYNWNRLNRVYGIEPKDVKLELKINTRYVVTMIARVDVDKDYSCYVEIAKRIGKIRHDITFLAVGGGPLLEHFIESTKNEENIRFLGFCQEVEKILKITTVSVLCSNVHRHAEGVSNAILESMASGVPVIATLAGGSPEIIVNGENGFCIKDNNVDEFIEKILLFIDDNVKYSSATNACRRTVVEKFSLEKSTQEYIKLYQKLKR